MRWVIKVLIFISVLHMNPALAMGADSSDRDWKADFAAIPIQSRGRTMPIDTLARNLAVEITGRTRWTGARSPAALAGRDHLDLLADLLFKPNEMFQEELIPIEHLSLKSRIGLNPDARYFSPMELMLNDRLHVVSTELQSKMLRDPMYSPSPDEQALMDAQNRITAISFFVAGNGLAIVPIENTDTFASVGVHQADQSTEHVQRALLAMQDAYLNQGDLNAATDSLLAAIIANAPHTQATRSRVRIELFYNTHKPWQMAAIASILALLLLAIRKILHSKKITTIITMLAALAIAWSAGEQALGLWLRIAILDRAPVSNTYEALLWMGIVTLTIGIFGQLRSPKSYCLPAGLIGSLLAILFAMLVPLDSQTNALPAVLRSNYWLVIHVLTIVAAYGALLLTAVLAHAHLILCILFRSQPEPNDRLIAHIYRIMQIGALLLTAGTILGGVWAADSWGRFWGWDPKETWSLISIILYFTLLHARRTEWIHDFGFAVATIVGFVAIVWTFYGVNYVLASGLHSYGFGTGGGIWLAAWIIAEIVFIQICFVLAPPDPPGTADHSQAT